MKLFILLLALLGAVATHPSIPPHLSAKWTSFKADHGKNYAPHVELARARTFAENVRFIEEHNEKFARGEVTYKLGLNAHSDMTPEEFRKAHLGRVVNEEYRTANISKHVTMPGAGEYVDWRTKGAVSSVKSQTACGACYAFAAVGLIESYLLKKGEYDIDLSEQDVIDCTYYVNPIGLNAGCVGGGALFTVRQALEKGLASEDDYHYISGFTKEQGECQNKKKRKDLSQFSPVYVDISEDDFANALAHGPLLIGLNGENPDFHHYSGGIYNYEYCDELPNHAALLVGYGKEGNQEYWIIKNSWGTSWGEDGYMRMAKGFNRCGIASDAAYYLK